jgi:hypothetical protein
MILLLLFLETGLIVSNMDNTEEATRVYQEQKALEEEEQERLLEKEPGEKDDDALPKVDILDVSMEDQEEGVPPVPPPVASTTPTNDIRQGSHSKSNPKEGEKIGTISSHANPNVGANPNKGDKSKDSVSAANPNMGANNIPTNTGNGANPSKGASTTSNKVKIYLATRNNAVTSKPTNLFGGVGLPVTECGNFLIEGDCRFEQSFVRSDISTGINLTFSFDPDSLSCCCCGQFRFRQGRGGRGGQKESSGLSLIRTFPPSYPAALGRRA